MEESRKARKAAEEAAKTAAGMEEQGNVVMWAIAVLMNLFAIVALVASFRTL
jgi:hypothetical protein